MNLHEKHASWLFIAVISVRQTSENQPTYNYICRCVNGDFTNRHSNSFH